MGWLKTALKIITVIPVVVELGKKAYAIIKGAVASKKKPPVVEEDKDDD